MPNPCQCTTNLNLSQISGLVLRKPNAKLYLITHSDFISQRLFRSQLYHIPLPRGQAPVVTFSKHQTAAGQYGTLLSLYHGLRSNIAMSTNKIEYLPHQATTTNSLVKKAEMSKDCRENQIKFNTEFKTCLKKNQIELLLLNCPG